MTPLALAASAASKPRMIAALLKVAQDVNAKNNARETPLIRAANTTQIPT